MLQHLLLTSLFLLLIPTSSAQCNTNQNPYCKGNKKLESICCPYPNVCYWERGGAPACCPAGTSCLAQNGIFSAPAEPDETTVYYTQTNGQSTIYETYTPTPQQETVVATVPAQQSYTTITSYPSTPQQTVVVVTSQQGPVESVYSVVTSNVESVYSVVTSGVESVYSVVTSDVVSGYNGLTQTVGSVIEGPTTTAVLVFNNDASVAKSSRVLPVLGTFGLMVWLLL